MQEIIFTASFGDEKKDVRLSQPDGIGGDIWFLMIDNLFWGQIWKLEDAWICHHQDLTTDDIQILGEIIEKQISFDIRKRHF